jgi:hypothetical protein
MLVQLKEGVRIEFIDAYYDITAGTPAIIEKVDYNTGKINGVTAEGRKFSINYYDTKSNFRVKTTCMTGFEMWDYLRDTYGLAEGKKIAFDFIKESSADADSQKFCHELRESIKKAILEEALKQKSLKED